MQMVCRPLPRPAAHNHGVRIIAAERRIERPQKTLLVGGQEPAALIADPAPDREAAEREGEDRDDPHDIEQGGGTIQKRGKPRPPILSKRLRDEGQRSRHLAPGVRQRVEKHIHGAAPRDRGAASPSPSARASLVGSSPADRRAPSARISWVRASTSRTVSSGVPPDPGGASNDCAAASSDVAPVRASARDDPALASMLSKVPRAMSAGLSTGAYV